MTRHRARGRSPTVVTGTLSIDSGAGNRRKRGWAPVLHYLAIVEVIRLRTKEQTQREQTQGEQTQGEQTQGEPYGDDPSRHSDLDVARRPACVGARAADPIVRRR